MTICVYVRGEFNDVFYKFNKQGKVNRLHVSHKVYGIGIRKVCWISEACTQIQFQGDFNGCGMVYPSRNNRRDKCRTIDVEKDIN